MSSRTSVLRLELLEDRITPTSSGLLTSLLSLPAGLLGQPLLSTNADGGSQAGAQTSPVSGSGLQLNLPGLSVLGVGLQGRLSLNLDGPAGGLGLGYLDVGITGDHVGVGTGPGAPAPPGNSLPPAPEAPGIPPSLPTNPSPLLPVAPGPTAPPANTFSGLAGSVPVAVLAPVPLPLPLSFGASGFVASESSLNPAAATGPTAKEQQPIPTAELAFSSPLANQTSVVGGEDANNLDQQDAETTPGKKIGPNGAGAGLALEGADLATQFQPGIAEAVAPLSDFDLFEKPDAASELPLWLLLAASGSALGVTLLAWRRGKREADLIGLEDVLGGDSLQ